MQTVGRPCEVCGKSILSEIDGVGCARCERFFHDACVLEPPAEPEKSETYRAAAAATTKADKPKKKKRKVRCPGCGADVRKELRERHHEATLVREHYEERRRVAAASRTESSGLPMMFAIRLGIAGVIGVGFLLAALVRACGAS